MLMLALFWCDGPTKDDDDYETDVKSSDSTEYDEDSSEVEEAGASSFHRPESKFASNCNQVHSHLLQYFWFKIFHSFSNVLWIPEYIYHFQDQGESSEGETVSSAEPALESNPVRNEIKTSSNWPSFPGNHSQVCCEPTCSISFYLSKLANYYIPPWSVAATTAGCLISSLWWWFSFWDRRFITQYPWLKSPRG